MHWRFVLPFYFSVLTTNAALKSGIKGANSWDAWQGATNQTQTLAAAQYLAANLLSSGYDLLTLDGGWSVSFDGYGRQVPDPKQYTDFPGMVRAVHALGLRLGVWTLRGIPVGAVKANLPIANSSFHAADAARAAGDQACSWDTDNYGVESNAAGAAYYASVAEWYAQLGVDFVKVDCMVSDSGWVPPPPLRALFHRLHPNTQPHPQPSSGLYTEDFTAFAKAMAAVGIVVSVSPGNSMNVDNATYISENALAAQYRISNDLWDSWGDKCPQCFPTGVKSKLDLMPQYATLIGFNGAFADLDMLPMGTIFHDGGSGPPSHTLLTEGEQLVLLSLAYITRAPLIFGGRLPLDPADTFTLPTLTNPDALAVHDNSSSPRPVNTSAGAGLVYAWAADAGEGGPAATTGVYVALFNANDGNSSAATTPATSFFTPARGHYLSHNCAGCGPGEGWAPVRDEGYALLASCGGGASCVPMATYYSASTGANLVVPAGYAPIPDGFAPWAGNPLFVLPLNYSGGAPTAVLELWAGSPPGMAPAVDYWSLASNASRAEAVARGYSKVADLARLFTAPAVDPGVPVGVSLASLQRFAANASVCAADLWARAQVPGTFNATADFVVKLPPHSAGLYLLGADACPWVAGSR